MEEPSPASGAPRHAAPDAEELALFSERGRDLLLLALAIMVVNEALFASIAIAGGHPAPVANVGRFALISGLCYMTWQGFSVSRWVLVVLAAVAGATGPWQVVEAYGGGRIGFALLLAAAAGGYVLVFVLLAVQGDVGRFIRHRRLVRERDVLR